MYGRSQLDGILGSPRESPLTIGILISVAALYIATLAGLPVYECLSFDASHFPVNFWTVITWPLVPMAGNPINLLFELGWFYLFAGSIERAWGTRDFGTVLLSSSLGMAIFCWIGLLIAGASGLANGFLGGLGALTGVCMVAWAIINKRETVSLFFLPIPAIIIGWAGVAMTWYYGGGKLSGLFLLPVCAAMYWYATQGRYRSTGYRANPSRYDFDETPAFSGRRSTRQSLDESGPQRFNVIRWWRDRQEKKRLEEIFRRSGFTDDDERR